MADPTKHDTDMRVIHDVVSKTVLVMFRGKVELLGPYSDKRVATEAAEAFCRKLGWAG